MWVPVFVLYLLQKSLGLSASAHDFNWSIEIFVGEAPVTWLELFWFKALSIQSSALAREVQRIQLCHEVPCELVRSNERIQGD